MKWNLKEFLIAMAIRAIRTFAQTLAAALTVGALWTEVQWIPALSAAGVAFVYSILMSIATGLPEVPAAEEQEDKETEEEAKEE